MAYRLGSGYMGSEEMQTSTANQEIIPSKPEHWTKGYNFYKFSFYNEQPVRVLINSKHTIYLNAGQCFNSDSIDAPIYSFIILDPNVSFNWIGAF